MEYDKNTQKIINTMWTEKYRPKKLDEMVGSFKDKVRNYLNNHQAMQHLLLYSLTPGTGKTTLGKVIINELKADALILNSSEERKIETVREKVLNFVRTKSSNMGIRKVVLLDEADGLTFPAQNALKNLMETYSENALFILSCNYFSKISEAIVSRCCVINFSQPQKDEILNHLINICENENLEYTKDGLKKIIEINYPSIRNCVKVLQDLKVSGLVADEQEAKSADEQYQVLWNKIIQEKDWKFVKNYLFQNYIDVRKLNKFFWFKAISNSNIKMIQITASNEDRMIRGGEEIIIFVTSLIDMVR